MQKIFLKLAVMATALLMLMYSLWTQNPGSEIWFGLVAVVFLGIGIVAFLKQRQS